jgi:MFS family permease
MIGNAVACFLFSASSSKPILYLMRFMLGFTQAFCVVYSPVWVNEFSPRKSNTKWMAILHSFAIIGVMIGYIFGAIIINFFAKSLGWRFAFMIQGWFMLFIGAGFLCCDNNALDIFKGPNALKEQARPISISEVNKHPFEKND